MKDTAATLLLRALSKNPSTKYESFETSLRRKRSKLSEVTLVLRLERCLRDRLYSGRAQTALFWTLSPGYCTPYPVSTM
jgi:hypothetical protein